MTAGVYLIRCLRDGRVYVGSSVNCRRRYYGHRSLLRRGIHFSASLQEAWCRDGPEGFELEVLTACDDQAKRLELETAEIVARGATDPAMGFNATERATTAAGDSRPKSADHRRRLSAAQKGREKTALERQRISQTQLKRLAAPEAREVLRQAKLGFRHTSEARQKIAAAGSGRRHSPEALERIREAARRRWADPDLGPRLRASFEEAKRKGRHAPS